MKQLLILCLFLCSTSMCAQDVIVKKDGSTILSKVLEVNTDNIKYRKHSNQNGPTYTINKSEIMSINYENGDKDIFGDSQSEQISTNQSNDRLVEKPADANNGMVIGLHNIIYPNFNGKAPNNKFSRYCTAKLGIKSNSILSNDDIEIKFVRKPADARRRGEEQIWYFINIQNKTNKVLYVDKGNCFKVYNDGYSYCYYDPSLQTTISNGGNGGGLLNLGSVAGALGIGGIAGQIAGGVNIGGGTSSSHSTTYIPQRIIAIPPHGSKFLTECIWVGEGKREICVERPESFRLSPYFYGIIYGYPEHEFKTPIEIGLIKGIVSDYDVKNFSEDELHWKRDYYITYSTDANFSSYSILHAELYIQQIIGDIISYLNLVKWHNKGIWFQNENTIIAELYLDKD